MGCLHDMERDGDGGVVAREINPLNFQLCDRLSNNRTALSSWVCYRLLNECCAVIQVLVSWFRLSSAGNKVDTSEEVLFSHLKTQNLGPFHTQKLTNGFALSIVFSFHWIKAMEQMLHWWNGGFTLELDPGLFQRALRFPPVSRWRWWGSSYSAGLHPHG